MSITSYIENEKTFYKVYVNICSTKYPEIREQSRRKGFETIEAAKAEEKKILRKLTASVAEQELLGSSWGVLINRWENAKLDDRHKEYAPTTVKDYASILRKWTQIWHKRSVVELNKGDVKDVLKLMETEGCSRKYQNNVKNIINLVYDWGIEEKLVKTTSPSPARGVEAFGRKAEPVPDIYTLDEIRKLMFTAKMREHPWYPIWVMAVSTGMRSGELHALTWSDVDLSNRRITVSKSFSNRMDLVKSTKGGYWRTVPISPELHNFLFNLKKDNGDREHVLPRFRDWDKGEQARVLRTFCIGVGLPSIRFHALRACFATQLLGDGIKADRVMKICGWKELNTMQRYIRLAGIDEMGATDNLRFLSEDDQVAESISTFAKTAGL